MRFLQEKERARDRKRELEKEKVKPWSLILLNP